MKSHLHEFEMRDLVRLLVLPLVPVALVAIFLHLGAWTRLFPPSRPALDTDHTILIHQVEAARKHSGADVLLIGDSSCLMNVSAKGAGEQLGQKVLNLGTLSYLDLKAFGALVREFTIANPAPRAVVVLMHPEALRRPGPEAYWTNFLHQVLAGTAPTQLNASRNQLDALLGVDELRSRVLSRWLPMPLPGNYGQQYGFTHDLENYLEQNNGSLIDPVTSKFEGNAEYRLARQMESASRLFRGTVPGTTKLFVGITPVPARFPRSNYVPLHSQMLKQWSEWLGAEPLSLPAVMPDHLFVKTTHLNRAGAEQYTALLSQALKPRLGPQ